jgi:hypothetical protein
MLNTPGFEGTKLTKGEHVINGGNLPMIFSVPTSRAEKYSRVDRASV